MFCWVKNGDTIEPLHSEWCRLNRGNRNVYFTTKSSASTIRLASTNRRRPRRGRAASDDRFRLVQRDGCGGKRVCSGGSAVCVCSGFGGWVPDGHCQFRSPNPGESVRCDGAPHTGACGAAGADSEGDQGENREELGALAQRVDRVDARLDRPEASSASTKTDHVLHSHLDKVPADLRKLQEKS